MDSGEYGGPLAIEADRDGEIAATVKRFRFVAEDAWRRVWPATCGPWVIEPVEQAA
jgi:hypothetical protein